MFLNDFLSLVLNCKEISPKKGSGKISKRFSTVNFTGDSVKTSITFLKQDNHSFMLKQRKHKEKE